MKIKEPNCLTSIMQAASNPSQVEKSREDLFRDEHDGIIVDTVCAFDTGIWETGIKIDGEWIILSQYEDKKSAEKGHKKFLKEVKSGKRDFQTIF